MISDLLDVSKAESGQLTLNNAPYRVDSLIEMSVHLFEHRAWMGNLTLVRQAPSSMLYPQECR